MRKRNHYSRLSIGFSEPVRHNRSAESILAGFSLILKMAEQLSAEDFTEFIDSLTSIVERTASVYRASDHVGLESVQGSLRNTQECLSPYHCHKIPL